VGKEKVPFHITINDSTLDDELSVQFRDFGPGMSKETIVKVFSTFGESTKINSNLETGCLGLGSKSPFAVTTTFMVISYIDNIKYVYNMSKDAVGRPKITLFTESYTEEPNGMEISIPLNRNSYNKHQILEAIRKELYFFRTKPKVFTK
jgi:DNA topoisomerase VI subunit B